MGEDPKQLAAQAHRLHQLKKEAIEYYQQNGAPQKMEQSLNLMFKEKPECVFGYLSNFFEELANPAKISGVRAVAGYDNRGVESVRATVQCRFRNRETDMGCATGIVQHSVYDHDKQEMKDAELEEIMQQARAAVSAINEGMFQELSSLGLDPRKQRDFDEFLVEKINAEEQRLKEEFQQEAEQAEAEEPNEPVAQSKPKAASGSAKKKGKGKEVIIIPDEPREGFIPGSMAVSTLSLANCLAGAAAAHQPLYRHLRGIFNSDNEQWRLPLPMITILCGGKSSLGKSNCIKEYMLVPLPSLPFNEVFSSASRVYQHVAKSLGVKGGPSVRFTNDIGALNATLDRPETGFELINEALRSLELVDSFQLAINVAGHELFDYEKGKYDLMQGTQKTPDELADFFVDMLNKQPTVMAIIDPMRRVEQEAWARLCQRVSERCLIVGDFAHHRAGLLLQEELNENFRTSGWAPRLQQRTTVTEIFDCAKKMQAAGNEVIPSVGPSDTSSTAIVDLAVALDARFLKLGAPVRSERVDKFMRLMEIGQQLSESQELSQWSDLIPSSLVPPPASDEAAEGNESSEKEPTSARSRKGSSNARS